MSDWTLPLQATLVAGKSGSGKNSYVYRYLLNAENVACRFIFDDLGQAALRLKIPQAGTANELEASLQTRWSNFNPHRMFPGELRRAFLYWCEWVFKASQRGRGKKIVFIDEVWRFQDREKIPVQLATLAQMGRAENVHLICATQRPNETSDSITGNLSELVCFALDDSAQLKKVRQLGANDSEVSALPKGSFIAYNKDDSSVIRGKLF